MTTDTRTALLDSAEQAARTRGFDGFSYADLAKDVGIRKASIHHHFATKAALSMALMRRYRAGIEAACADIERSHPTGAARLGALIGLYRDALQGGKSLCLCVSFSASRESLPAEVIVEIDHFRQAVINWIKMVFATGQSDRTIAGVVDPQEEAAATLALLEGAQLAARAGESVVLFENALQLLQRRI
ncbi:MAG: TetR/AcrR family transcriptional regulator [Albidovulum sp.]